MDRSLHRSSVVRPTTRPLLRPLQPLRRHRHLSHLIRTLLQQQSNRLLSPPTTQHCSLCEVNCERTLTSAVSNWPSRTHSRLLPRPQLSTLLRRYLSSVLALRPLHWRRCILRWGSCEKRWQTYEERCIVSRKKSPGSKRTCTRRSEPSSAPNRSTTK